jgi:methionine sulfoxide reductase heme-binding subunit
VQYRRLLGRHLILGMLAFTFWNVFWFTRLDWSADMRFWRAVGDAGFMLLVLALALGPLVKLAPGFAHLLPWRREMGIWFGILSLAHGLLILNGWVQWDLLRLMGYEFIPQLGRQARLEPGFGLANMIGMVALGWALVLTATSSNWAVDRLGASAWKWLQYGAYIVFYLVGLHVAYFLFIHYTISFHRDVPPNPNWFQIPFILLALIVPTLQVAAFVKTVRRKHTMVEAVAQTPTTPRRTRTGKQV